MVVMIDNLPAEVKPLPMRFYVDNLFTSFPLATEMKRRGYQLTGTLRENKIPKDIPLKGGSRAVVRGAIFFGALFGCLPSGVNPR